MSAIGIEVNQGLQKRVLVMPIEGVLRKPVGGQVNIDGIYLYHALIGSYRIILVTYETNAQRTKDWLDKEGIFGYDDILYGNMAILITESYWANMLRIIRNRGGTPALVVVNSPQDALEVANANVPVLLYTQPSYGLSDWLPGSQKGDADWAALVERVESDITARRADRRMDDRVE